MSISVPEFWNLALQGQLLTPQQCQDLASSYAGMKGADPNGSASPLAEWLVAQRTISRYQATVLLAGQPGPFAYGDYLVYDRVEKGRFAGQFRAVHVPTSHPVCLYFLTGEIAQDPQKFAALMESASRAAQARCPHLLRCYETADTGQYKFIVVEDPQGTLLQDKLAAGPIPPRVACALTRELALALAQIHQLGERHAEIRPGNVLIDTSGHAKLIYFPLWRDPAAGPTALSTGGETLAAAAGYLAPEVATGQPDARSDVYSLGCLMYHMLTGRPPYAGETPEQALAGHQSGRFEPANEVNVEVPPPVAQVVDYLLQNDPARRYQTADNAAQALQPYVEPALSAAPQPLPTSQPFEDYLAQQALPSAMSTPAAPAAPAAAVPAASFPAVQPVAAASPAAPAVPAVGPVVSADAPAGPVISTETSSGQPNTLASRRAQSRGDRKNRQTMFLCGSILAAAAIIVFIIVGLSGERDEVDGKKVANNGPPGKKITNPPPKINGKAKTKIKTKSKTPGREEAPIRPIHANSDVWASPTAGPPLNLTYMPRGVQAFIVLRPAEIMAHPEGKYLLVPQGVGGEMFAATGPSFGPEMMKQVSALCGGLPWEELEQVVIGLLPNPPNAPQAAVVMRTKQPVSLDSLTKAAGLEYRMPGGADRVVVAAPGKKPATGGAKSPFNDGFSAIDDAMKNSDGPVLSRPEIEALLRVSDNQRHFTLLCAPGFFYTDGKGVWTGLAERLKDPLSGFVGDPHQLQAGMFSVHLTEFASFLELRLYGIAEKTNTVLASELDQRLEELPKEMKQLYLKVRPSDFSSPILFELPTMARALVDSTMVGTCDRHAVLRCYLPSMAKDQRFAASNLVFAGYLALAESLGGGGPVVVAKKAPEPKTLAEVLKLKKYTLVGEDEFQVHLRSMGEELGIPVEILGKDLESEGITRNKRVKVEQRDKPIGEVIQAMFKTVDPAGRLVYVIKKDGDTEKLYITVRKKALERKDPIPPEFAEPKKK